MTAHPRQSGAMGPTNQSSHAYAGRLLSSGDETKRYLALRLRRAAGRRRRGPAGAGRARRRRRRRRPRRRRRSICERGAFLKVAPIVYRERRLANGLQVITVENHSSPTVSVQVWYHVGSRDDPPGRSGFAHLFEHMMFKSTANLRAEQFDRLTEDVGGDNNAFDRRRRHRLPRGRAVEPPRDAALGRGRADDEPQGRRGQLQVGARRRRGGVPPARPRLAVRPPLQRVLVGVVPRASVQAAGDRQHRGPRGGDARRRRRLPRAPLPARQRDARRRRRLRPEAARRLDRQVLRRRCRSPPRRCRAFEAREPAWPSDRTSPGHRPAGAAARGRARSGWRRR